MLLTSEKKKINDLIFGRIIVIIAIQIFLLVYSFVYYTRIDIHRLNLLTIVNLLSLISCTMAFKAVQKDFSSVKINTLLAIFDSSYIVVLISLTGHNNSPFILLLPLYIFFTSITFRSWGMFFSTTLSVVLLFTNYFLTRTPVLDSNFIVILSSVLILFGLITRYFVEKSKSAAKDAAIFNKLNTLLVENMELGIININKKGFISSVNKIAEKIFKDKETINKRIDELIEAGSREPHKIVLDDDVHIFIYRVETHSGTALVIKDVSKDDKTDKLSLINTIAAVLAHEIKNPVSSIAGVSELIRTDRDVLLNQIQREKLLGIIDRESSRLTSLVEEFLIYSGSEKRKNEEINLNVLLQNSCDSIRSNKEFISKGLELEFSPCENNEYKIQGDFQRVMQAIDNIMVNAMQACTKDGKIKTRLNCDSSSIALSISDTGVGIPSEIKNRIFEPFFTTKDKGTGLGLAIVNNIITAHRGEIEILDNNPGTIFKIKFPKE